MHTRGFIPVRCFKALLPLQFSRRKLVLHEKVKPPAANLAASSMAEPVARDPPKRYAVVTGANKGIGYEICRQLASKGITVVLTSRNDKRGVEAVEKLKESGVSEDAVLFHQLDVVEPSSVASLAQFVKTRFGRLDILVNNAGVLGVITDTGGKTQANVTWSDLKFTQTYELAVECLEINYYGAKRMMDTFVPLLRLSSSPRIVNVSSGMGKLKNISNEWARRTLNDVLGLRAEKVDEVLNAYLKDFKEGSLQANGWPSYMSAYVVSKAAVNAYSRLLAHRCPEIKINCVCPGFVNTDMSYNTGTLPVEEGAASPVWHALRPNGPSGMFFDQKEATSF